MNEWNKVPFYEQRVCKLSERVFVISRYDFPMHLALQGYRDRVAWNTWAKIKLAISLIGVPHERLFDALSLEQLQW